MRLIFAVILISLTTVQAAQAQIRNGIGSSSIFTNDYLGDRGDRWRTGSFSYSHLRARQSYTGALQGFGDIFEYRLRSEIMTPSSGSHRPGDRPFVGAVSFAVNTHFARDDRLYTLGVELTAIGPQTGQARLLQDFHNTFSLPQPPFVDDQLGNQFAFSGSGEIATYRRVSDQISLRTFGGFAIGAEDMVRIGADFRYSDFGHSDLMLRDVVTGQLHAGTANTGTGFALIAGADLAHVVDSIYLPADRIAGIETSRFRARIGADYKFTQTASAYYGVTYLSPEFEGQSEGQILGSLRLKFNF